MQISRHWRLNSQRYRLQGVRYENGETSLQNRPRPLSLAYPLIEEASKMKIRTEVEGQGRKMEIIA